MTDFGDKTLIVLVFCRLFWYINDEKSLYRCKEISFFFFIEFLYFFFIVILYMCMGLNRIGRCFVVGFLDSFCLMIFFGKFGWRIFFFNFLFFKFSLVCFLLVNFSSKYLWVDLVFGIMVNLFFGYSFVRLVIYFGFGGWSVSF